MLFSELTDKQCWIISRDYPSWLADYRPEWMAANRPEWMAANRPQTAKTVPDEIMDLIAK